MWGLGSLEDFHILKSATSWISNYFSSKNFEAGDSWSNGDLNALDKEHRKVIEKTAIVATAR